MKSRIMPVKDAQNTVAPRVGAWIEIKTQYTYTLLYH